MSQLDPSKSLEKLKYSHIEPFFNESSQFTNLSKTLYLLLEHGAEKTVIIYLDRQYDDDAFVSVNHSLFKKSSSSNRVGKIISQD